jgi:hypothetical protein
VVTDVEERAIDGEYGQVYINGVWQNDIQDFTGTVSFEQRTIKVAGSNRQVYRRGMVSRSGSFTWLKVDSALEAYMLNGYADLDPDQRRANRAQGIDTFPDILIAVVLDDPESWGSEELHLSGGKLWTLPIGYSNTAMLTRNVTCTWDQEAVVGIPRPGNTYGFTTPSGEKTWVGAGQGAAPLI